MYEVCAREIIGVQSTSCILHQVGHVYMQRHEPNSYMHVPINLVRVRIDAASPVTGLKKSVYVYLVVNFQQIKRHAQDNHPGELLPG